MNAPPKESIRVDAELLATFVTACLEKAGLRQAEALLIGQLLSSNDLRGVFSHGTQQVRNYVSHFKNRHLNPAPEVRLLNESPTTMVYDGDGSLGYFAAHKAAQAVVPKAREMGVAIAVTRNHGHIGAAGIYSRIVMEEGLIGYVTSGAQMHLQPERLMLGAGGGSPHSFGIPAGNAPGLLLDFGAMHDIYHETGRKIYELAPGLVFRSLGLGTICQTLGGLLCGVPADEYKAVREWKGANQGSFILALDIERFIPRETFLAQMEDYHRLVSQMQPMPGCDKSYLPGGLEAERFAAWKEEGVPVGEAHRQLLEDVGKEMGVPLNP
ncbi:MAG: Ldh family oxidoreductase [Planctomycetota bacterium]|nr:Ldh family oxidoreductase [Planctomycetota bacterium]MDA1137127.1 Ldh family oxidoreductase [Planctomycetota bacterium]